MPHSLTSYSIQLQNGKKKKKKEEEEEEGRVGSQALT